MLQGTEAADLEIMERHGKYGHGNELDCVMKALEEARICFEL